MIRRYAMSSALIWVSVVVFYSRSTLAPSLLSEICLAVGHLTCLIQFFGSTRLVGL